MKVIVLASLSALFIKFIFTSSIFYFPFLYVSMFLTKGQMFRVESMEVFPIMLEISHKFHIRQAVLIFSRILENWGCQNVLQSSAQSHGLIREECWSHRVKMSVFGVILFHIQSKCGKIQARITPNTDTFHAVSTGQYQRRELTEMDSLPEELSKTFWKNSVKHFGRNYVSSDVSDSTYICEI